MSEKRVPFNMNDDVFVKLNSRGKKIYFDYLKMDSYPAWNRPDERGFVRFQAHEFMSIFGEHISPHVFGSPFDLNIEITIRAGSLPLSLDNP